MTTDKKKGNIVRTAPTSPRPKGTPEGQNGSVTTDEKKQALEALKEVEKAFWYAEKGDAFSGYGIILVKNSIETIRAALTPTDDVVQKIKHEAESQHTLWQNAESTSKCKYHQGIKDGLNKALSILEAAMEGK